MKYKVGIITHDLLNQLPEQVNARIKDDELELVIIEGLVGELHDKVLPHLFSGVNVCVAAGANAVWMKKHTNVHLKTIEYKLHDYMYAIQQVQRHAQRIGIVIYSDSYFEPCRVLGEMLQLDIVPILYEDEYTVTNFLKKDRVDVVVGASLAVQAATAEGIDSVRIYPSCETIVQAIYDAKLVAEEIHKGKMSELRSHMIIDTAWWGLIVSDHDGRITSFNPAGEGMLGLSKENVVGKMLGEIWPEWLPEEVLRSGTAKIGMLNRVNGHKVVVNRVPIVVNGVMEGSIVSFTSADTVKLHEAKKTRLSPSGKGFAAKHNFDDLVGQSPAFKSILRTAKNYARSVLNVCITGETGTGKELFAQSIHSESPFSEGPFVAINCAALPENLLESELFGYDEGAFTGSRKGGKIGLFELANSGSIFLDEVDQISLSIQARLLRVLQEREVIRLGGNKVVPISVRIISACNTSLESCVERRAFREDLYYRLNVLSLHIPPLRERGEDALLLFMQLLESDNFYLNGLTSQQRDRLGTVVQEYPWPGNIREMENVVKRMTISWGGEDRCGATDAKRKKSSPLESPSVDIEAVVSLLVEAIGCERYIKAVVNRHAGPDNKNKLPPQLAKKLIEILPGNREDIAEMLGFSRTTLWRLLNNSQE